MAISTVDYLFQGVTTTTPGTSAKYFDLSLRGNKSFQFVRSNHGSGSAVFEIEVSLDGTNWVTYNRLVSNITNTNTQNDTKVSSGTLSANGSVLFLTEHGEQLRYVRGSITVVTDGSHDLILSSAEA